MTTFPLRCREGMTPALIPCGTWTVPKPVTVYDDAAGCASYRSRSYMVTGMVWSTTPVICHCQVVPGLGFQTDPAVGGRTRARVGCGMLTAAAAPALSRCSTAVPGRLTSAHRST